MAAALLVLASVVAASSPTRPAVSVYEPALCFDASSDCSLAPLSPPAPSYLDCTRASVWTDAMVGTCDLPRLVARGTTSLTAAHAAPGRPAPAWSAAPSERAAAAPVSVPRPEPDAPLALMAALAFVPALTARPLAATSRPLAARLEDLRLDRPPRA